MVKITGNEPAMPMQSVGFDVASKDISFPNGKYDFLVNFKGLTIRQQFAATAPAEIPDWFIHIPNLAPIQPPGWTDIKWADKQTEDIVSSWHVDPCFDLGEEMHWYQEQWETYWKIKREYDRDEKEERYFQWRTYYADALIKELNKEKP